MILVMMQTTEYEGGGAKRTGPAISGCGPWRSGCFGRTVPPYPGAVYAMALSILKNTHDAQDVTLENRKLLQTALAALSQTERQVVLLHAGTGLKHREIAGILELPLATVLSKYHRALRKLKEWMEGDDAL